MFSCGNKLIIKAGNGLEEMNREMKDTNTPWHYQGFLE